jgi:hypothetical protein
MLIGQVPAPTSHCTGEPLIMWSQVKHYLLCFAALESIHSLLEAREEKRGKKREKPDIM